MPPIFTGVEQTHACACAQVSEIGALSFVIWGAILFGKAVGIYTVGAPLVVASALVLTTARQAWACTASGSRCPRASGTPSSS